MNINSINYSAYTASASSAKTKDSATTESSSASVSVTQTTITADTYVPSESSKASFDTYKPSLSAKEIESLENYTQEVMSGLAEKMIRAQNKYSNAAGGASTGLDFATLAQAMGLSTDATIGDVQGIVDGLQLGIDVSGMSYGDIASTLGLGTTPEAAAAAISEDGMWGVNAVSTRLMDMAVRLSGGDTEKIAMLREAVTKGFEAVGDIDSLPQVCQDTYAETMSRFDHWEQNGTMDGYGSSTEESEPQAPEQAPVE